MYAEITVHLGDSIVSFKYANFPINHDQNLANAVQYCKDWNAASQAAPPFCRFAV
jgi:hypothetical protein